MAKVTSKGKVTGIKAGKATITVKEVLKKGKKKKRKKVKRRKEHWERLKLR